MLEHQDITETTDNLETIVVDFNKVAVFGRYVKTVSFKNFNNKEILSYRIRRDPDVHPIYRVFYFTKYEGFIQTDRDFKLKVIYTPTVPFRKDTDNFEFVDSSFKIIKIITKGESLGPFLSFSAKKLNFVLTPGKKKQKKTIEIKNSSKVPAEFLFDFDDGQSLFNIEPKKGTIPSCKHLYISITFSPNSYGHFSQQLVCLILAQEPVIIDIFGLSTQKNVDEKNIIFKTYPFPFEETVGYGGYLRDSINIKRSVPPISLSKSYINFGRLVIEDDENELNVKEVTSLTNHMDYEIEVVWTQGEVFKIKPEKIVIPRKNTASFECSFAPTDPETLYNKTVTAQVYWQLETPPEHRKSWNIPLTISISLQGHSYPEEATVITNIELIPTDVTFPPCLPGDNSYQTLKIRNYGILPVMYRLLPPKISNVVIKPMAGLVTDFVIIVLHLRTLKNVRKIYEEQWNLELNGRRDRLIPVNIKGMSSIPSIEVGDNNKIKFETVQVGTRSALEFPVRNTSCFHVRFKIELQGNNIEIKPTQGELAPHDVTYLTGECEGTLCGPKSVTVKCKLQALHKIEEIIGEEYDHSFTIYFECSYSKLCAAPNNYDFGEIRFGTNLQTTFHIFNFGETTIYFHLVTINRFYNKDSFKLQPNIGEVKPREKLTIEVIGTGKTIGENEILVSYMDRISKDSSDLVPNLGSEQLFKFCYYCLLPTFQIEEIVGHNFGPLFTKMHFRHYLQIQRLNQMLRDISNDETKTIELSLPDLEIGSCERSVTLLVRNITEFESDIALKRKQLCSCKRKEVKDTFNTTKCMFDCPHRDMLLMELPSYNFFGKSQQFLTIRVKYSLPGKTKLAYLLHLSDKRQIELIFSIHAIPNDFGTISCYKGSCRMKFKDVFLGRRVAPLQMFWLYNNTNITTKYQLDVSELNRICQTDGFKVLECINAEGEVEPYSAWPLIFRFHPIEMKEYHATLPLTLGAHSEHLFLRGIGCLTKLKDPFFYEIPEYTKTSYTFPVTVSRDYLAIDSLVTWNTTERIIFIKNVSNDKIMLYEWMETGIRNVVKITTTTKSGTLQPKESHTIVLKIKTYNEACLTEITMPCILSDYTELFTHRRSVALREESQMAMECEFILSDKISSQPTENELFCTDEPEPQAITITIGLNIVHSKEGEAYFSLKHHLISTPQAEIDINVSNIINHCMYFQNPEENYERKIEIGLERIDYIKNVMEELISETVFNSSFKDLIKISANQPPPFYNQFVIDEDVMSKNKFKKSLSNEDLKKLRETEVDKLFSRPKLPVLAEILTELILDGVQATFKICSTQPLEIDEKKLEKEVETLIKSTINFKN